MNATLGTAAEELLAQAPRDTILSFPEGLPGLESIDSWQLVENADTRPFFWLRAVGRDNLGLLVVDPRLIEPDYCPGFSRAELARVGATPGVPVVVLAVVTLAADGATVNLRAPLVLNPDRMTGAQIILEDATWPLRRPLLATENR